MKTGFSTGFGVFLPVIFMQNIAQNRRVTIMGYKSRVEDMVVSS
jgi:hypothetical protein